MAENQKYTYKKINIFIIKKKLNKNKFYLRTKISIKMKLEIKYIRKKRKEIKAFNKELLLS